MSRAAAAPDPFEEMFADCDEARAGIAQLEHGPPLWGNRIEWTELIGGLRAFEERGYGGAARDAGWTNLSLYGLHPVAPRARVGAMGAAFLIALRGHQVVEVGPDAIRLVTRTCARLRIFRGEPDQGTVLAWELAAERR